jgi:signal transduction histidine kinase
LRRARQGATDYVLKDRPARLPAVVRRAVDEAGQRSRLARMEAHLQRSQRLEAFGRLAAGVAHEFNNQVGAMLSYAAFIRQEAASRTHHGSDDEAWDGIRRDAEQIEQAGQRVTRLVHQLLTAGGQQISRPGLIDLNQVIGGIDELLRTTAGASIEFRMSPAPRLRLAAADKGQLEQVLLNLTMNARDAMPGGGSFSIQTQNVTVGPGEAEDLGLTPGAYVRLTARDSGPGMEPEILKHAFEPFFTTKPFVEGAGLGLATVYGIITQAAGTVGISSAPGAGTTVTAWLPAASETAASSGQPAGTPREDHDLIPRDQHA